MKRGSRGPSPEPRASIAGRRDVTPTKSRGESKPTKKKAKKKAKEKPGGLNEAIPLLLPSQILTQPHHVAMKMPLERLGYGAAAVVREDGTVMQYTHPNHAEGVLIPNPEAVALLNSINEEFAVVMVTGPAGSQKSAFLNYILDQCGVDGARHFPNSLQGMKGLWMWPQVVYLHHTPILLLDCESFNPSTATSELEYLFGVSSMLSNAVVYNTMAYPLTLEKMNSLDNLASLLQRSTHNIAASSEAIAEQTSLPYLTYCLRDWPAEIPVDPAHPLVIESSAGSPQSLKALEGRHMFCSLPVSKPDPSQVPVKPKKKKSTGTKKPKAKAKAKKVKSHDLAACDPAFASKFPLVLGSIVERLGPVVHTGKTLVALLYGLLTAAQMAADGKGLEADVKRLVHKYTAAVRQEFADYQKKCPMPAPTLKDHILTTIQNAGSRMFDDVVALNRSTRPPNMESAQQSSEYILRLMDPDIQTLIAQNEMAYDEEILQLVRRLVAERMSDLQSVTSKEMALKVWPSQIPADLVGVADTIQKRVAEQMQVALQVFEHTVQEAVQTVLWTLVSPYFQLMNGAEYPRDHIPDLNGGVEAIEEAFQHHCDTLLFPNVGAAYELFQASQATGDNAHLRLPTAQEVRSTFAERIEHVPSFLVPDIGAQVAPLKQGLGELCHKYVLMEIARVYTNVLRELLVPMGLGQISYSEHWVELSPHAGAQLPEEIPPLLRQLVYESPVVTNRDILVQRWEHHKDAILQLTVPAISQLFTDVNPCNDLQHQFQAGLRNLITGSAALITATLPELLQQVVVEVEGGEARTPEAIAQCVRTEMGVTVLHACPASGGGCRLVLDSPSTAFTVLQQESWPPEWGFRVQPLQVPRLLLSGLPANADERSVQELIGMYSGVELQNVNMKRPFVELIPASNAHLDLLVSAGHVRLLGTPCEIGEFEGFDLHVPSAGQEGRFPEKEALQTALSADLAFVEGRDPNTVRVGLWSPLAKAAIVAALEDKGFKVPHYPGRRSNVTFLGKFPVTSDVSVSVPIDEYRDLTWDPVEYKQQVGDLVERLRRQVPADKLASAIHKDPNLRNFRRIAMLATLAAAENRYYYAGDTKVELAPGESIITTNYAPVLPDVPGPKFQSTQVLIEDSDMVALSGHLSRTGERVLMLNMANPTQPGGGWNTGVAAQEEDLFRRSDYALGLTPMGNAGQMAQYPIPVFGCIVTENVTIFRDDEQEGYAFLPDPFTLSIIAVAAFNCHNYIPPGQTARAPATAKMPSGDLVLTDEVYAHTRSKVETLVRAAIDKGFEVLVLSALGCGAFGNPPLSMAHIFHEVLQEYAGHFRQIHFAIKNEDICDVFQSVLATEYKPSGQGPRKGPRGDLMALMPPPADTDTAQELCQVKPVFAGQRKGAEINFASHVQELKHSILAWMKREGIRPPLREGPAFLRIVEFFRNSRPVHRCTFDKLHNMLRTGAVLSLNCVETLVNNPSQMVDLVLTHPLVTPVCQSYLEHRVALREMVKTKLLLCLQNEVRTATAASGDDDAFRYDPKKAQYYEDSLKREFGPLLVAMADSIGLLDAVVYGMVKSALDVRKAGIGFSRDRTLGTDEYIFAVQGINIAGTYGRIRLIFHPDVMHHPNFFVTPFAAVFFVDDAESLARYAFNRPWVDFGYSKPWTAGGKEQFIKHMLHPSSPEVFETLALEFVARVLHWKGLRDGSVITWEMVMEYWHRYSHNADPNCPEEQRELESSHWAPEAHCPYSMPLSYVEHVVMSEETYNDTFTPDLQRALKAMFPSLHVERDEQRAHEKSVQLATAPHRSRKGYCFSLVADVNETYVPIIRDPFKPLHLYFKAKGSFAVVFSNEMSDTVPNRLAYTVTVNKGEVVVFEGSTLTPVSKRKVLAQVPDFNQRLNESEFIFYYCSLDPVKNQVILDHWGPSEFYTTSQELVMECPLGFPKDLKYISFKALDALTTFHDVHTRADRAPPVTNPEQLSSDQNAGPQPTDFSTVYQVVDVDDEDVEKDIYNMAVAGKTAFGADVQRDAFGVALGSDFDLATPGSRTGWNVLVGNFGQRHELTESALEECAFVSLRKLGFSIEYTEDEAAFVRHLRRGPSTDRPKPTHHLASIPRNQELLKQWHVVWIVSGPQMKNKSVNPKAFTDAVVRCHLKGNGLLLWAENQPFYYHANLVLPALQQSSGCPEIRLTGNTCGQGQILTPGTATVKCQYGSHYITTGVEKLFEGNTICYPTHTAQFTVLGTSSAGYPVLMYGDCRTQLQGQYCGRVVVDNGWTKLVPALWATAGTPRYISNTTSWLAFLERMSRKYRMPSDQPTTPLQSPIAVISVEPPTGYSSVPHVPGQAGGSLTVPGYVTNTSFSTYSEESGEEWEDEDEDEDDEEEDEDWETDED